MQSIAKEDIVIVDGARTPVGKFLGSLKKVSATNLGAAAARGALERSAVSPDWVDAVYVGNVIQSSKDAAYIARHVGLMAGAPMETPALTVNRACGSALEAIVQGAKSLAFGEAEFVLAGGAENMSMTPYAMRGVRDGWKMVKSDVDDMLFSALYDPMAGCQIGETVEHVAEKYKISREAADEIAVLSQRRAAEAREKGILAEEIVPFEIKGGKGKITRIEHDENLRSDTSLEGISKLPPMFKPDGIVTAGNSSGLNDAGAMVVMTTGKSAKDRGLKPLGRILSWGTAGVEPKMMGIGPVPASRQALQRAELKIEDMDVVELNDSFTVQYLAVEKELGLNRDNVNRNGGAIAIGHPMGATGSRLVLAALYELRRKGGRYALATLCIGGGQGAAIVLERQED